MAGRCVSRFNGSRLGSVAKRSRKVRDVGAEKILPENAKGPLPFPSREQFCSASPNAQRNGLHLSAHEIVRGADHIAAFGPQNSTDVPLTKASLGSTIALLNRRLYEIPRKQRTSRTVESSEGAF